MARRKAKLPAQPPGGFHYPWYLKEWLQTLEVTQAELGRRADLSKATISDLVSGKLQYSQTHIDRIAWELKVRPFELLLPPEHAMTLRQLAEAHRSVGALPPATQPGLPPEPTAFSVWPRRSSR